MTGRSVLLASALMAVGGVWAGSAGAAPIHADTSLQGDAVVEQVQMRGDRGGNRGGNRGGSVGMSRGSGGGGAVGINRSGGGNWSGNRAIRGENFANNSRPGNWQGGNWSGRRDFADGRNRRGFRGPGVAFGFGPSYYGYGYDYGYSGYDAYPYDDGAYAYVAPGPAVVEGDSVAYCQQRFRSYDPSTGTYLGYDGLRHPCP